MGKEKFTYDYVFDYFIKHKCLLLSKTYINSLKKLKFKCECGKISEISFARFKTGSRCNGCRYQRSLKTNKKNHQGKLAQQTNDFINKRKKTCLQKYGTTAPLKNKHILNKLNKTNLKRYGKLWVSQVEDVKRKSREACLQKYGVEYCHQNKEVRNKFYKTMLKKYGTKNAGQLANISSKQSQKLFEAIYKKLPKPLQQKCYFHNLNNEFVKRLKNGKCFKYDFVNSKVKKCIEYNGHKFHPLPKLKNSDKGWHVFNEQLTAGEVRKIEKEKYDHLKLFGYDILTVWDLDYHKDFNKLVSKCVDFLCSN